jgi:hypothetical protein
MSARASNPAPAGKKRLSPSVKRRRKQRNGVVTKTLETTIEMKANPHEIEDLLEQMDNLLEDEATARKFSAHPIGWVAAALCCTLGLEPDLERFSDAELGIQGMLRELMAQYAEERAARAVRPLRHLPPVPLTPGDEWDVARQPATKAKENENAAISPSPTLAPCGSLASVSEASPPIAPRRVNPLMTR